VFIVVSIYFVINSVQKLWIHPHIWSHQHRKSNSQSGCHLIEGKYNNKIQNTNHILHDESENLSLFLLKGVGAFISGKHIKFSLSMLVDLNSSLKNIYGDRISFQIC